MEEMKRLKVGWDIHEGKERLKGKKWNGKEKINGIQEMMSKGESTKGRNY